MANGSQKSFYNPMAISKIRVPKATESFEPCKVLHLVKDAQQKFGLRHGDYQRYRQYCARRISRMRKSLNFPQGDRHKIVPKKITEERLADVRFLHLPVFEAERSWAYAMQLKIQAQTESRKQHHMMKKLKKAVVHSELLLVLCASHKCDAMTKLEAQAYSAWMKGTLLFEQEKWHPAIEQFTNAKTIYEKMAGAFVDDMKETYLGRVEEISPNIRYCAYNIGDESAINDLVQMRMKGATGGDVFTSSLDALIEKTREKQSSTFSEVMWRGRTFPVKNERVRVSLLTLQETEKQLAEAEAGTDKISLYESLMKELIDAQQALREDLKDDQAFKAMQRGQEIEGRVPNSIFLHTYLAYLRQTKTIERNLLMIESLKANLPGNRQDERQKMTKPQDLVRLYDIIIQNLSEISNLPGLEEDEQLKEELTAKSSGYKTFKCYYAAQSCVVAKKWQDAVALLKRTQEYAQAAIKAYQSVKVKEKEVRALEELLQEVEGQTYSCYASYILEREDPSTNKTTLTAQDKKKPLSERLDTYYEDPSLVGKKPNLVQFPPDFETVPCKPLFFDVAGSMVQLPDLTDKIQTKKEAAGGLGGMVKGWFWGKK